MSYGLFALWSQLVENDIQTWWVAKQKLLNQPMIMQKILMKCIYLSLTWPTGHCTVLSKESASWIFDRTVNWELRLAAAIKCLSLFVLDQCSSTPAPPAPCMKYLSLFHPIGDPLRRSWNPHIFSWESQEIHNIQNFCYPFLADYEERLKNPPIFPCFNSPSARHCTAWQMFFLFCPESSSPGNISYLLFWVRLDICLACVKYACLRVVGAVLIDTRDGVASNKTEPIRETSIDRQHTAGIKTHKQTTGNPFSHIIWLIN